MPPNGFWSIGEREARRQVAPTETVAEKPRMCPVCLKEAASNGIRFCENCGAPLGE